MPAAWEIAVKGGCESTHQRGVPPPLPLSAPVPACTDLSPLPGTARHCPALSRSTARICLRRRRRRRRWSATVPGRATEAASGREWTRVLGDPGHNTESSGPPTRRDRRTVASATRTSPNAREPGPRVPTPSPSRYHFNRKSVITRIGRAIIWTRARRGWQSRCSMCLQDERHCHRWD